MQIVLPSKPVTPYNWYAQKGGQKYLTLVSTYRLQYDAESEANADTRNHSLVLLKDVFFYQW